MTKPLSFRPITDAITQYKSHWIIPLSTANQKLFSFATISEDGWAVGRHNQTLLTIESLTQDQSTAQQWIDKNGPERELLTKEKQAEFRDILIENLDVRYVMGVLRLSMEGFRKHWQDFPYSEPDQDHLEQLDLDINSLSKLAEILLSNVIERLDKLEKIDSFFNIGKI